MNILNMMKNIGENKISYGAHVLKTILGIPYVIVALLMLTCRNMCRMVVWRNNPRRRWQQTKVSLVFARGDSTSVRRDYSRKELLPDLDWQSCLLTLSFEIPFSLLFHSVFEPLFKQGTESSFWIIIEKWIRISILLFRTSVICLAQRIGFTWIAEEEVHKQIPLPSWKCHTFRLRGLSLRSFSLSLLHPGPASFFLIQHIVFLIPYSKEI